MVATEAPGCHLDEPDAAESTAAVTYHNRISRIVQFHCVECHREGGVAPFSLESHADVVAHAAMIETVVERGTMPPWFAAPGAEDEASPWRNDRSLASEDKRDLLAWLAGDRNAGDPSDAPLPIRFPTGWTIGEPDLVVQFPEAIPVQATGVMDYEHTSVELDLAEDKWVERIEIRPGAPEVVHHILVFVRSPGDESRRRRRGADDGISYWGIYVPGNSKQVYPQGYARKLPAGSTLIFQLHYTPNGTATEDRTQVGFVFADREPDYEVKTASLVNSWFEIPPGADDHTDYAKVRLPEDITVLGFLPHMHLRGKACNYEAFFPDGEQELLLDIPHYDFNWQLLYQLAEPRRFKEGTVITFNATFDNSADNPANPDPNAAVRWGEQTYDEMIVGYLEYFVPAGQGGDRPSLTGDREQTYFTVLDEDNDNRLAVAEFQKFGEKGRARDLNPVTSVFIFKALDADGDGLLTIDEFRNLGEMFRRQRRGGNRRDRDS